MAYNALNNLIDAYIYANGVQAITGQILNGVLKQMVSQLGSGYHLMGVAGPETVPASNDYAMAYFAATAGEYTDFGGITLAAGEVAVLLTSGNGSWSKQTIYNVPTTTEDLENTANFITNAVTDLVNYYTKTEVDDTLANYPTLEALATTLADYYTKTEIDGQKDEMDAALGDRYTKSETDTKLEDYYKKTETYDKDEVDSIIAALSRQEYIVAWDGLAAPDVSAIPAGVTVTYSGTTYTGTLAASASTVNKIYMVWNGTAYDMYGTSQDGGYSWVPMGTTTVDLSQYATSAELSQLEAEVNEKADQADLSQLRQKLTDKINSGVLTSGDEETARYDEQDKYYTVSAGTVRAYNVTGINTKIYDVSGLIGETLHIESTRIANPSYVVVAVFAGAGSALVGQIAQTSETDIDMDVIVPDGALYLYVNYQAGTTCNVLSINKFNIREEIGETVRVEPQSLTAEQQKNARTNIGLGNGDIDNVPTDGSDNVITSGGVYGALYQKVGSPIAETYTFTDKVATVSSGNLYTPALAGNNYGAYGCSNYVGERVNIKTTLLQGQTVTGVIVGASNVVLGIISTNTQLVNMDVEIPENALWIYLNYDATTVPTITFYKSVSKLANIAIGNNTPLEDVINSEISDLYGTFTLNSAINLADGQRLTGHNCVITCDEFAKINVGNSGIIDGIRFVGNWNPTRVHGNGVTYTQFGYEPIKFVHNANQVPRYHEVGKYAVLSGSAVTLTNSTECNCKIYQTTQLIGLSVKIRTIVPDGYIAYYVCDANGAVLLSGTGDVNENVIVPEGAATIYINYGTAKNGFLTINNGTEEYLTLDDLKDVAPGMCGPGRQSYDALINVDIDKCYNTTIRNCIFKGLDRVAITMAARRHTENSNGQIYGNYFYNCFVAVFLSGEFIRLYGNEYTGCVIGLFSYVSNLNHYGEIYKCCDCAIYLAANHTGHSELSATQIAHSGLATLYARGILPTLGYQICNCHLVDGAITGFNINNLLIVSGRIDVYFKYTDGGSRNSILCSNIGKGYLYGNPLYDVPVDTQIALNRGLATCSDAEANNQL